MNKQINIDQICLVCLREGSQMFSIFLKHNGAKDFACILKALSNKFTQIDGLPQQLCGECKQSATNCFEFKTKCEQSLQHFVEMLKIKSSTACSRVDAETQTETTCIHSCQICKTNVSDEKQDLNKIVTAFCSLPNLEEKDLKALTENSFPTVNYEQEEDFLVYIKQFEDMTDEKGSKTLSSFKKADKSFAFLNEPESCAQTRNKKILKNKQRSGQTGKKDEFICQMCKEGFKDDSKLQQHILAKHGDKFHKCSICNKAFKTATYLQKHVMLHTNKRFSCKECLRNFLTKGELNDHVKSEGHNKRLLCPTCGLRCRSSSILMIHIRRHKGEKPFKCKFCSKGFPRSDDLRLHEKYHTGEKSHFCGICGKGFQRKYNLKIHLRVHTGEKPFKCSHCPQAFAQGNDLKAHIRRHTGERFNCEFCDAAFLHGYQIRQHKLNEHDIRDDPPTQRVEKFTSIEAQQQQILRNTKKVDNFFSG